MRFFLVFLLGVASGGALTNYLHEPNSESRWTRQSTRESPAVPAVADETPKISSPGSSESSSVALTLRTGGLRELRGLLAMPGLVFGDDAVLALVERLRERDSATFRVVLYLLKKSGTARAQRALVQVLGDTSVALHPADVRACVSALQDRGIAGVAEAAARRLEHAFTYRVGNTPDMRALMTLVALHGDLDTSSKLKALAAEKAVLSTYWQSLVNAASRPRIAEEFAAHFKGADGYERLRLRALFPKLALSNPDLTVELVGREIKAVTGHALGPLVRSLATAANERNFENVRSILVECDQIEQRLEATYAIEILSRKGLEVSAFDRIRSAPVEELERLVSADANSGSTRRRFTRLLHIIEHNRVTWTHRSAQALELAGATHPKFAKRLRMAAAQIRSELSLDE